MYSFPDLAFLGSFNYTPTLEYVYGTFLKTDFNMNQMS